MRKSGHCLGEHRELQKLFEYFGDNLSEFGDRWKRTYVDGTAQTSNPVDWTLRSVSGAIEGISELQNAAVNGIFGNELNRGSGSYTLQDTGQFASHVVTLHPIKALGDLTNIIGSDWYVDAARFVSGAREPDSVYRETRTNIEQALAESEFTVAT